MKKLIQIINTPSSDTIFALKAGDAYPHVIYNCDLLGLFDDGSTEWVYVEITGETSVVRDMAGFVGFDRPDDKQGPKGLKGPS